MLKINCVFLPFIFTMWFDFSNFSVSYVFKLRLFHSQRNSNNLLWLPIEHTQWHIFFMFNTHRHTAKQNVFVSRSRTAALTNETKAKINICQPLHNKLLVVVRLKESDVLILSQVRLSINTISNTQQKKSTTP